MAGYGEPESYDWALARITELRVDLETALANAERAQDDNAQLRVVHDGLVDAYKRLQMQTERTKEHLQKEQDEKQDIVREHQRQLAQSRSQLESKARECEDAQQRAVAPVEIHALRMQIAEEVQEPYEKKLRDLEGRMALEQRRSADLQRQLEQERSKAKMAEAELKEDLDAQKLAARSREQALERKLATLEADAARLGEQEAQALSLRGQLREQEMKTKGLQKALQDLEHRSERESASMAENLRQMVDEASEARRRAHQIELQLDEEDRKRTSLQADLEAARREHLTLKQQLSQAEAKAQAVVLEVPEETRRLREELSQQRAALASEREQRSKSVKALEDKAQAADLAAKRAESKQVQLEEEHRQRLLDAQEAQEQAETRLASENASLRAQLDAAEKEAETRRHNWHERESSLLQQVEEAVSRVEALNDELLQCQVTQEEQERRLGESQRAQQQHNHVHQTAASSLEHDLIAMKSKVEMLEKDRSEQAAAADSLQKSLQKEQQCCQSVQAELAATTSRLDAERLGWAKQSDEAQAVWLAAEEQRRSAAMQRQAEEHKKQMQKLVSATKKALQKEKAKQKRKDQSNKCHELVKRVAQLQAEKATAIRICQENKSAYELHLAELGMAVGVGPRASETPTAGGSLHRRELRAISERLERHAEW
eukprot:CAMPEP_0197660968 /NCGR_PEP_ID=MMETSP1338-20131121/51170_1 /TAXON_ID=43686 ORGANISM="Pelagodinium beii, Strain RCC1491" /NCGR_SAMPLE_ID=MMETSP1338 /ASSEMBLY_ACC=CAM_ASM_000754 /LENGTH=660 /DNA_ID=CAMNT_0043238431 /DNA_START=32 /DNA_END=2011 /DNA_ORIENTATION=+